MQRINRIVVTVVGGTVLALGITLIALPGPAFLVIPAGLAVLAVEFAWARRWLRRARTLVWANHPPGHGAKTGQQGLANHRPLADLARGRRQKRRLCRHASRRANSMSPAPATIWIPDGWRTSSNFPPSNQRPENAQTSHAARLQLG